jgi:hypothetical protein
MWDIEKFRPAPAEAQEVASSLRGWVSANELDDSRLPDFVVLTEIFHKPCLPFREHYVDSLSAHIYALLQNHGESQIIVFENPLYEESSEHVAAAQLNDATDLRTLIDEQFFSGGFIVSTVSPFFRWLGNFTDYGFMFTDKSVIEEIFGAPALKTYNAESRAFRAAHSGSALLDSQIRKLDKLWF